MRQVRHLLFHQASFAASLGLGGAILLLILGTQILNWYWPVLLFVVSLAAGAYRARNKVLSRYQVAQSIDRQLGFHDSLSTAVYFSEHSGRTVSSPEFIENQKEAAEALARSADVQHGLPFLTPRTLYVNAALAAIVFSMFGVRYGINHSLDLRPSLVRIGFDGFLGQSRDVAEAKRARGKQPFDPDNRPKGTAADPWDAKAEDPNATPDAALDAANEPEVTDPSSTPDGSAKSKATGAEQPPPGQDPLDSSDKGENSQAGSDSGDTNNPDSNNSQNDKQDSSMKNSGQSGNAGENSSLSEKMRDALANLMAKLKPNKSDGKQSSSQSQNGSQSSQQKSQSTESNSSQSQNKQQADGDASAQSQGDQQSQNGSQQSAQGKSEGKSSDKPNSPDGKSGIGKQDGDKSAREAAELAAMGKISEIIGKRAANVSGEVMVEVASGKQQLKTQYSQRSAQHSEAGSEINRDEVPLAYQQYVQQYFEEIRKMPAAKSKVKGSGN
jgi:hypothetical protein